MQTQNINFIEKFSKAKKQHSFKTSTYLNLPDLQFFYYCNRQYQINRGVYQTIDQCLYDDGVINIHHRRILVLAFLDFVKGEIGEQEQTKFIRFGHGGLARKLKEFMSDSGQNENVIPLKR